MEKAFSPPHCDPLPLVAQRTISTALERATDALLQLQRADGHFCGELEGDSILESEYLLMKFILGQEQSPMADGSDGPQTLKKIASCLRRQQREDGGWGQFPGSGVDLSATVKAYFALKLMGDDPADDHMRRARSVVREHGGAERCNSFTNFYLACLGQISWNAVPAIPPEIVLLPRLSYVHLSKVSAWTRTMILPLALVVTLRPTRRVSHTLEAVLLRSRGVAESANGSEPNQLTFPPALSRLPGCSDHEPIGIDELFLSERDRHRLMIMTDAPRRWRAFFGATDRALKLLHPFGGTPLRKRAIKRAEAWMLARAGQDGIAATDGLGAIFPPMVYLQIAFHALGYSREHPVIQRAERELDALFIEENDAIRIQPCFSPVWDTGIALYALSDAGLNSNHEAVERAATWLRKRECRHVGDWAMNLKRKRVLRHSVPCEDSSHKQSARRADVPDPARRAGVPASHTGGAWFFEYHNAWYPDVDDTAMVAMALFRAGGDENRAAAERGVEWMLQMQNDDGGWAAFDRTRHRAILEYIPFADHNAMQDPSCPDITGRVLECLAWHGFTTRDEPVRSAIEYIKSKQEPDGCFFGRWGVNYLYGTWQAVVGPIRCGVDRRADWIQRAGAWLRSVQKDDGSFGESANSYEDSLLKGRGPSTASQTAWAAMTLQEIFGADDPTVERAIDWLVRSQLTDEAATDPAGNPDGDPAGSWVESEFTGTGFPRVFYLRYHLYRLYFPLMAIGRFFAARQAGSAANAARRLGPKIHSRAAASSKATQLHGFSAPNSL